MGADADIKKVSKAILNGFQAAIQKGASQRIAREVVTVMKDKVSVGKGTIKGSGKLKKYSDSYKAAIKGDVSFRTRRSDGQLIPFDWKKVKQGISGRGRRPSPRRGAGRRRKKKGFLSRLAKSFRKKFGKKEVRRRTRGRSGPTDLQVAFALKPKQAKVFLADRQKFKNKRTTPVNKFLSGKMMSKLKSEINSQDGSVDVGFFQDRAATLEQFHREQKTPRPIIPQGSERFNTDIEKLILNIYTAELDKLLSKL